MTLPTWYDAGTVSVAGSSTTVTGINTLWGGDAIMTGDLFCDPAQPLVPPQRIKQVVSDTELELWAPWPGATMTEASYEIRYVGIIERSTAQTRKVLEQLGDVKAYYDVQVDTLADRAGFDSRPEGYRVLVSDIGDGRAAIYSKATSADGDWTDPAYISGPIGPTAEVTVGGTTTLAPGSAAEVTPTPTPEGVSLAFGIPAGRGATSRGDYNPATEYVLDDAVLDNGSTWIALGPTTGNAPPVLPATSNEWWQLLARAGQDGAGTGDVVGPAGAVDGAFAAYDGTSGKLLKQLSGADATALLDVFAGSSKGLVPAAAPEDAEKLLKGDGTWAEAGGDVSFAQMQGFYSSLALEQAEDRMSGPVFAGPDGNGVFDGFNVLTYVDVAGATNLSTVVAGELRPTSSGVIVSTNGAISATASYDALDIGDRAWPLTNGSTVSKIGASRAAAMSGCKVKIARRVSAGTYDIVLSEMFNHPGGGFVDHDLANPFTVPPSGDFYALIYSPSNASFWDTVATGDRFNRLGDGSGSGLTFTEGSGTKPALRVTYAGTPADLSVRSEVLNASEVPEWGRLCALLVPGGGGVNSDIVFRLSRNGVDYQTLTMQDRGERPGGVIFVDSGIVDLSAIAAGTTGRWRLNTSNGVAARILAVGAEFGVY